MAKDAEVRIKIRTQLDKDRLNSDIKDLNWYIKDADRLLNGENNTYGRITRAANYEYTSKLKRILDSYKSAISEIESSTKFSKKSDDAREELRLKKEIDEIQSSTDSKSIKETRVLIAERKSALRTEHADSLRNINVRKEKSLAALESIKKAEEAKSRRKYSSDLTAAKDDYKDSLSSLESDFNALEQRRHKLSDVEYESLKKMYSDRKRSINDTYDYEKVKIKENLAYELNTINNKYNRIKSKIKERASSSILSENMKYDGASNIDTLGSGKSKEVLDSLKTEFGKVSNLFARGLSKVWSNYVKYGKSAISTVSNLFKSTIQKTYQGTVKLSEVLGLKGGVKEVDSVIEALGRLKSQLLSIAGVSISIKTLLGTTETSSELIEMQNVVDTVFGDMSDSVNSFAKSANTSLGLTEYQAKKFTSTFGSMFKTSGVSVDASRQMGENLTALSADLASFFDADFTEAFDKVKSGLAGMIMPLRAYGIDLSVAAMQQYMLDKGIQATWKDLSVAEKQMIRYNYMMERTTDMQGDFARTAGSWANQLRLLKNQVREISIVVGSFLEKSLYPVLRGLNSLLGVLVKVGHELQKIFNFESSDLLKQQGLSDANKGIAVDTGYNEEESEIDDLTSSTDKLTEAKKKLQKQNERQEASFDSLIKLSKQSTDATAAETSNTKPANKGKGTGLNIEPIDYKGLDLSKAPIKLPKWAKRIIRWAKDIESLFDKYGKRIKKKVDKMQDAWSPVSDKLGKSLDWTWGNILKPFMEWLLKDSIPATIDLLKALGGVVDSVMEPIGEVIKRVWKEVLEPFFKSMGTKYVNWVKNSTDMLDAWKAKFDSLETVEKKLDFLSKSVNNWFEGTIKKIFGEKSDEILKNFYSSWDSLGNVLDNIFSSSEEVANGKLFSNEFTTSVKNLAAAFAILASYHFYNITELLETITDNQVPLSDIVSNLSENFGKLETMIFTGINGLISMLAKNSKSVKKVTNTITDMLTTIGNTVFTGFTKALDKLMKLGTASKYIEIISNFLNEIASIAFNNVDELIDWLSDEDVSNTVESISNNIVTIFDNITKFIFESKDIILDLIKVVTDFVVFASEHPGAVAGIFGGLSLAKGVLGASTETIGGSLLKSILFGSGGEAGLLESIKASLGRVLSSAGSFVIGKITTYIPVIGSTIVSGISSLVAPIAAAVNLPIAAVVAIVAGAVAAIVAIVLNWDKIKNFFTNTVPTFFEERVKPWLSKLGTRLKNFVESLPDKIHDGVVATAEKFGKMLGKMYTFTTEKLPEILSYIRKWFLSLPEKIVEWWEGTKTAWKSGFNKLRDLVPELVNSIYNKFKQCFNNLKYYWENLGSNIINGIANGIRNGLSWLYNLAFDAANTFLNAFRSAAQIHSPSKKAYVLGEYLMDGLRNGVKYGLSSLNSQYNNVLQGTENFLSTLMDNFSSLQYSDMTSNMVLALDSMTLSAVERAKKRDISGLFNSDAMISRELKSNLNIGFDRSIAVSPRSNFDIRNKSKSYEESNKDLVDTLTDSMMMALQDSGALNKGKDSSEATVNIYLDSEKIATKVIDIADSKDVRSGGL